MHLINLTPVVRDYLVLVKVEQWFQLSLHFTDGLIVHDKYQEMLEDRLTVDVLKSVYQRHHNIWELRFLARDRNKNRQLIHKFCILYEF